VPFRLSAPALADRQLAARQNDWIGTCPLRPEQHGLPRTFCVNGAERPLRSRTADVRVALVEAARFLGGQLCVSLINEVDLQFVAAAPRTSPAHFHLSLAITPAPRTGFGEQARHSSFIATAGHQSLLSCHSRQGRNNVAHRACPERREGGAVGQYLPKASSPVGAAHALSI